MKGLFVLLASLWLTAFLAAAAETKGDHLTLELPKFAKAGALLTVRILHMDKAPVEVVWQAVSNGAHIEVPAGAAAFQPARSCVVSCATSAACSVRLARFWFSCGSVWWS